jgi:hypothetical protein
LFCSKIPSSFKLKAIQNRRKTRGIKFVVGKVLIIEMLQLWEGREQKKKLLSMDIKALTLLFYASLLYRIVQ